MLVRAPASSANLGPGFDCSRSRSTWPWLSSEQSAAHAAEDPDRPLRPAEPTHPAARAFREAGGAPDQPLWWASGIPPGRGLGFSGAARVAGAYLATRMTGLARDESRKQASRLQHGSRATPTTLPHRPTAGSW
ncbi:MAG: hypothetical protein R2789_19395 [Microthrixaceae bacterium]